MRTAYRAARLFDGDELRGCADGITVVVADGRVDAVLGGSAVPDDCVVIELGDVTILPGLIDAHVHLTWDGSADPIARVRQEPSELTVLRAANHAGEHLRAGVTVVRDLGSTGALAIEVARAIDAGILTGPRVLAAGRAIAMTGGHVYPIAREADGPDAVRQAVREQLKAGAQCIKIMASGGALDGPGDDLGAPQLSLPELRAAVEEANRVGRAVAAHAHSIESIRNVLTAGVTSIEHGTGLDAHAARWMSRDGIFLVPTLAAVDSVLEMARDTRGKSAVGRRVKVRAGHNGSAFRTALRFQVPIVAGSDSGVPGQRHGSLPAELAAMVREGATPERALRAATRDAAALLGIGADHGTVEFGKRADLLVVGGDPTMDILALRDVRMVIQNGWIVADQHVPYVPRTSADVASGIRELLRTYRTITRALTSRTAHPDLSGDQQRILLEVGVRPGTEIADLRAVLDIDASQLSRGVRDLAACGAIEVRPDSTDRRRRVVVVTEAGERTCQQLAAAQDKAIGTLLDRFTDAEQARLISAMDVVHGLVCTSMRR